jgi:hypothetical protein
MVENTNAIESRGTQQTKNSRSLGIPEIGIYVREVWLFARIRSFVRKK